MKISHNWLQTYFEKPIPSPEKLEALFAKHSFEVESTENISREDHREADFVFEIKVLPDRAHYCLSHEGVANEIAFITGLKISDRLAPEIKATVKNELEVKITDPKFCRRYMARVVEVKPIPTETPLWLKSALGSIGQRLISPIVDITNYVMYDIGQPMHAFDADKIKGSLSIRPAKEGERIVLLDGRELTLTATDNVIADDEGPLVVAGAKGGRRAEITNSTKRIILESANFEPTAVRRTSTKYDIRSDSSKRFENEITPEMTFQAMANASDLIKKIMPESEFGPVVDVYPIKPKQTVIEFDPSYLEDRLGIKIPLDEAQKILEIMGITVTSETSLKKSWTLTIPYKRLDLVIKEDIVEEVGRIYGYDHIVGILPPKLPKPPLLNSTFYFSEKIKNILIDQGFSEVSLYTLVEKGEVETLKPLAKDKAFARPDLSLGMGTCLERNALNADLLGLEAIKIFEIGHIFKEDSEEIHLAIGAKQIKKIKGLKSENLVREVLEILGRELDIESVFNQIKIQPSGIAEVNLSSIFTNYKSIGDFEDLGFKPASSNRYTKFSLYPFIVRDIALFVPESMTSETVWQTIEKGIIEAGAKELLVRHSLFDEFKKDGKISYAFRLVFQSYERTLSDAEINKIMDDLTKILNAKAGWQVR